MKKCAYCGKQPLPKGQRKYCNTDCADKFKEGGPAREQFVYKETTPDLDMIDAGAWLLMRAQQTDEECIGDFMRVWKRAPEHVVFDPKTPMWKYVGPIWTEEELDWRWKQ